MIVRYIILTLVAGCCFVSMTSNTLVGQDNSVHIRSAYRNQYERRGAGPAFTMEQANIIRSVPIQPPTIQLHDKISVRVDEIARTQAEGEMQQRKNINYNATILDWIRFNGFRKAEITQADGGDPRVQGNLQQLFRGESELETTERLTFNIAAEVVDTRVNGHLVIEASKQIEINEEMWLITLSGQCRQEDVGPDNVVLSRDVLNLKITKKEMGHVRDGYRRGWLQRALDQIHPF